MLADPRRRPPGSTASSTSKRAAGFGCRTLADAGLLEFGDDPARDDLLVVDDLLAPQIGAQGTSAASSRSSHSRRVCWPIYSCHLVDARGGIDRAPRRRRESRVLAQFGIAGGPAETLPFRIRNGAAGEVAVLRLEHEIGPVVRVGGRLLPCRRRCTASCLPARDTTPWRRASRPGCAAPARSSRGHRAQP